jgi:hypothetical protein
MLRGGIFRNRSNIQIFIQHKPRRGMRICLMLRKILDDFGYSQRNGDSNHARCQIIRYVGGFTRRLNATYQLPAALPKR